MKKTTYTCDRCGCDVCVRELGLVGPLPRPDPLLPPPTIEDIIREIVREEVSSA